MYAISHAASALLIKKRFPNVPLWPLLIAVQLVELIWCVLVWAGVERVSIHDHHLSLDFLPYSHSVATGLLLALAAVAILYRCHPRVELAIAVGVGIASHVLLDIVQHEPDIQLLPLPLDPRLGLCLIDLPLLNLAIELAWCAACWKIHGGGRTLLAGMVIFNLVNLPAMLQPRALVDMLAPHPARLPALILAQIVSTWFFIAWSAGRPRTERPSPDAAAASRSNGAARHEGGGQVQGC